MFIINQVGRVVGLPENMEESGFKQAKEVLSISSELMQYGNVQRMRGNLKVETKGMENLRDKILAKFPNVVTDEEYLSREGAAHEKLPPKDPVVDSKAVEDVEVDKEALVDMDMTKKEMVALASDNGIEISNQEERLTKDNLIELINARYQG